MPELVEHADNASFMPATSWVAPPIRSRSAVGQAADQERLEQPPVLLGHRVLTHLKLALQPLVELTDRLAAAAVADLHERQLGVIGDALAADLEVRARRQAVAELVGVAIDVGDQRFQATAGGQRLPRNTLSASSVRSSGQLSARA